MVNRNHIRQHATALPTHSRPGGRARARRTSLVSMKTTVTYPIVIEEQDGEFVTYVPALDFASTHGNTRDEALERTHELIVGYLEFARKEGLPVPGPASHTEISEVTVNRT
jgi:predicted RNase H-like HicB family nuclease